MADTTDHLKDPIIITIVDHLALTRARLAASRDLFERLATCVAEQSHTGANWAPIAADAETLAEAMEAIHRMAHEITSLTDALESERERSAILAEQLPEVANGRGTTVFEVEDAHVWLKRERPDFEHVSEGGVRTEFMLGRGDEEGNVFVTVANPEDTEQTERVGIVTMVALRAFVGESSPQAEGQGSDFERNLKSKAALADALIDRMGYTDEGDPVAFLGSLLDELGRLEDEASGDPHSPHAAADSLARFAGDRRWEHHDGTPVVPSLQVMAEMLRRGPAGGEPDETEPIKPRRPRPIAESDRIREAVREQFAAPSSPSVGAAVHDEQRIRALVCEELDFILGRCDPDGPDSWWCQLAQALIEEKASL
jgi:hypothetical protein